jgi:osmoprotectant transport system ATP-binding protein
MGDRIAVLQAGGVLAQYATPAELLMAPANAFVEDFVGADRALKRLALLRVRDIEPARAISGLGGPEPGLPRVEPDDALRDALARMLAHGVQEAVVAGTGGVISVRLISELLAGEAAEDGR